MKKTFGSAIIKIISLMILLALLVAGVVFLYRYTNGFNEDFKTFYIEHDGEQIFQSQSEMRFTAGAEAKFNVKYVFDHGEEARDYNVKIMPNEDESFNYYVDGVPKKWRAVDETKDFSSFFELKKDATSFSLVFPKEMTAETILCSIYPEDELTIDPSAFEFGRFLYRLEVSSYNNGVTYIINFAVDLPSLVLDQEVLIFGG